MSVEPLEKVIVGLADARSKITVSFWPSTLCTASSAPGNRAVGWLGSATPGPGAQVTPTTAV